MRLSVVIPTYNNREELRSCLAALAVQTSADFEVLVCVDGSTDGSIEYVRAATFPFLLRVLVHPDGQNHGRGATRNLATPHMAGESVLFLDSDMRLEPGAVAGHLDLLGSRDCVSIGDVEYANASTSLWARYLMTRGAAKHHRNESATAMDFHTANSAMSRDAFVASGGFDEGMTGYGGEDTELAIRLAARDRIFVRNPAAAAISVEPKSVPDGLAQRRSFAMTNLPRMMARHPDGPAPFWVDRIDSPRWPDRALRALMNPLSDVIADIAIRIPIFALQRRALDYKVLREVWAGYREGSR